MGRELVEGRRTRSGGLGGNERIAVLGWSDRADRLHSLGGTRGEVVEAMPEFGNGEPGKQPGPTGGKLGELRRREQGQQQVTGADAGQPGIQRGDQPGLLEEPGDVGRKDGRAGVAGLEAIDLGVQFALHAARADRTAVQDARQVAALVFQQGQQQVLEIDLVVAPGHAQARGPLCSPTAGVVEFADQGLERIAHRVTSSGRGFSR